MVSITTDSAVCRPSMPGRAADHPAVAAVDASRPQVGTPTPGPAPSPVPHRVRHGQGYSTFEQADAELPVETTLFVAPQDPVKLWRVTGNGKRST